MSLTGPLRDGAIWVMREKCATCIFRPGNLMDLKPGMVASMKRAADQQGTCIICHETMNGPSAGVCAGYYENHKSGLLQDAERMGLIRLTAQAPLLNQKGRTA